MRIGYRSVAVIAVCVVAACGGSSDPEIVTIEPAQGLVGGGESFTITGKNLGGAGVTVRFGSTQASQVDIVDDETIVGTIPAATALASTVTVTTEDGEATAAFEYVGLYAADGKSAVAGNLYLIDPRDASSLIIGPVVDGGGAGVPVTGLAFAPGGTLYATESTEDGLSGDARLFTVDPGSGVAAAIGTLLGPGDTVHGAVAGLSFDGETLYAYSRDGNDPVTVDRNTAAISVVGDGPISNGSGLATLADGTLVVANSGATGTLLNIDKANGATSTRATLQGDDPALNVNAMTLFRGELFGVFTIHDGNADSASNLAVIDPDTGAVTVRGTPPAGVDALASKHPAPVAASAARLALRAPAPTERSSEVAGSGSRCPKADSGRIRATGRDQPVVIGREPVRLADLLLPASGDATVWVQSCGESLARIPVATLSARPERYLLRVNRRGYVKLIDTGDERKRRVVGVTELTLQSQ